MEGKEFNLENKSEQVEQTPEEMEVKKALECAMERQCEALVTVLDPDRKGSREGVIIPEYFEGDFLWFTDANGCGFSIEINRITKVELPEEQNEK